MELLPHLSKQPHSEIDWFEALAALARYLRSPSGCPWDREQSAHRFAQYAVEEAGELVEALESGDNAEAEEEFGDALFVLLATAAAAEEEGRFNLFNAMRLAHEKMIRRHGHVFGDVKADSLDDIVAQWDKVKAEEKRNKGK